MTPESRNRWPCVGILILFLGATGSSFAEESEREDVASCFSAMSECVELDNDIERLQCFDGVAKVLDRRAAQPESPPVSSGSADSDTNEYPPTDPESVREADERGVENCEFLGTVLGKSGWGGIAARKGNKDAIRSAKRRAAEMGATHIVLGDFDNGSGVTMRSSTLPARAYFCRVDS